MEKIINPNNIKSFEKDEVKNIKANLARLEISEWKVLQTPPEIFEILWRFYTEENILVKSIEYNGDQVFTLWFVFPTYTLTKQGLEHVSWVQMTLARFQALYAWIILAIKKWLINTELTYEICLENLYNVLYRWGNITHTKVLFPWETSYLSIKISDVIKKWRFYTIECDFLKTKESFLFGKEKCILENRFVTN